MKILKKLWGVIVFAAIRIAFACWGLGTRVLYRAKVEYTDPQVPALMKRGVIFIANHTSHNDGFFVPQVLFTKKIYVLVTKKWYDKKKLNIIFRNLRYIPIDLNSTDTDWIKKTEDVLLRGNNVLIFPEGKLEEEGGREPFHPGFLLPARHLDVPVVPMALVGGYKKWRRQKIVVGSPIELDLQRRGRMSQILSEAAEKCRTEVFRLVDGSSHEKALEPSNK